MFRITSAAPDARPCLQRNAHLRHETSNTPVYRSIGILYLVYRTVNFDALPRLAPSFAWAFQVLKYCPILPSRLAPPRYSTAYAVACGHDSMATGLLQAIVSHYVDHKSSYASLLERKSGNTEMCECSQRTDKISALAKRGALGSSDRSPWSCTVPPTCTQPFASLCLLG